MLRSKVPPRRFVTSSVSCGIALWVRISFDVETLGLFDVVFPSDANDYRKTTLSNEQTKHKTSMNVSKKGLGKIKVGYVMIQ